jgi:hypothetical protein
MKKNRINISNKTVAYNGAIIAIASVFAYSLIVMIYTYIRSGITIHTLMRGEEINTILIANGFTVAYSIVIFSLLMAVLSSVAGLIASIILKNLLIYFNPGFDFIKVILIGCLTALSLLMLVYLVFYALLKEWMTFNYPSTFVFWFILPASIFLTVCIMGGSKLNKFYLNESENNL